MGANRLVPLVGGILLLASVFLSWLVTPLQGGIRGYAFALVEEVALADGLAKPLRLFSFGTVALLLGGLTGVAAWGGRRRSLFWLGAAALLLAWYFAGSMAFLRSAMLEAVVEQNIQRQDIKQFDARHVGGNAAKLSMRDLSTDSLYHRVLSTLWVCGFGWQLAVAAGILLQLWALWLERRRLLSHAVGFSVLWLLVSLGLAGRAVAAEYAMLHGNSLQARGAFEPARLSYERARAWNANLEHHAIYAHRLGEVYSQLQLWNRAEAYIYRGDLAMQKQEFRKAMQAYEQALSVRPDHMVAWRKRVNAYVAAGQSHFTATEPHKAIAEWEKALELDRRHVLLPFYLGRAYFEVKRTPLAITAYREALARSGDQLVRSDIYIMLGDCYYRQRDFAEARAMYQSSLAQYQSVTYLLNFLARKKLQGI